MKATRNSSAALLCLAALFSLASCELFPAKDDPSQYYVLGGLDESGDSKKLATDSGMIVQVGPTTVATYLERNQIITRKGSTRMEVAEFHLWGESLDKGISRVVTRNLSQLLDSPSVVPYPEIDLAEYDYRVGILVNRFEATGNGSVILDCSWSIGGAPGEGVEDSAHASKITVKYDQPAGLGTDEGAEDEVGPSREATAKAMSEAVNRLSVEIARALLKRGKPKVEGEDEEAAAEAEDG